MNNVNPVVLVHGMWHGSWAWSLVTEELAAHGVPSIAVDLDGHGLKQHSPLSRWGRPFDAAAYAAEPARSAAVTATSAAATLAGQIRRAGRGRPCVVVAHSMGGSVATAAAEAAPELFAELVYVSAFAPVGGRPAASYLALPENAGEEISALLIGDPGGIGALRLDPADTARHAAIRQAFYHDVEDATAGAAIAMLSTDGALGIAGEAFAVTSHRYGRIPHTYVVCTQDRVIPAALQRHIVKEIDTVSDRPTSVVELAASHSPFLSTPARLAATIATAHRRRG